MRNIERFAGAGVLSVAALSVIGCGDQSTPYVEPTVENANANIVDLGEIGSFYNAYEIQTRNGFDCLVVVNKEFRNVAPAISCPINHKEVLE